MGSTSTGAAIVGGTMMAIAGGISLGSIGEPPFNYASATPAERTEYLQRVAEPMRDGLRRGLISPSGIGPKLSLSKTRIDPYAGKITFIIGVSGVRSLGGALALVDRRMREAACPRYLKGDLASNRVRIVHKFMSTNGAEMGRITLSPDQCAPFAA